MRDVLDSWPVFDGHNDLPYRVRQIDENAPAVDIGRLAATHTDLERLAAGGVGAQWWSVWVPADQPEEMALRQVLEQVDLVHRWVARQPDRMVLCTSAAEVERAHASGRLASLLGAEGGHSIASSLGALRMLAALGVRYMTLTHNFSTAWADSATDAPRVGGLSDFGREVVAEMERLGVLVDLSHVAPSTMHDALDVATRPLVFSHSSARAVCDHVRNVPDDVLARLTGNGGVCMVTFVAGFVSDEVRLWELEVEAAAEEQGVGAEGLAAFALTRGPRPVATVQQVADHVEHVRAVAGIDHVGLGGDYDGCPVLVDGMGDVTGYPVLLEELRSRGWPAKDLGRLTWRNALRVLAGG
ncbi:MAG: dipeptidase [Actinobacteria bacterium]|nr:dipeptidase [Actinomycetota bacterium]MCA1721106.1 dipeptidase [Actinomycetota bacterium]